MLHEKDFTKATQLAFPWEPAIPRPRHGFRSIERDFPVLEISRLARIESYRKNIYRPAYYIHKWWARRTGVTFRAILLGTLLPEGYSPLDFLYQAHNFQDAVILDPFMGGGTTVGEAVRLRARVIGVDINPVAWFLVKKIVEPVSLHALDRAYRELEEKVSAEILRLYQTNCPACGGPAQAVYTYWVKVVPCQTCGEEVPLRKSMILARHASKPNTGLVTCPSCGHPYISTTLDRSQTCPLCHTIFEASRGLSRGAYYICPVCGTRDTILRAVRSAKEPPHHRMVALHTYCPTCGKRYKKPEASDLVHYERIVGRLENDRRRWLYPHEPIPQGFNTRQMLNYNYRFWFQMFNARQLIGLSTLLRAILALQDPNVRELMLLLFSGVLEFNNMFCSPKGLGTGAIRHIFAHHAFIPAKEPLEANLWGVARSSGGFSTLYRERLRRGKIYAHQPLERRLIGDSVVKVPIPGERLESSLAESFEELVTSPEKHVFLLNRSSTELPEIPDQSVDAVVTDPPYLDNVMYAELSDFFYVWLRLGLKDRYAQWQAPSSRRSEEAIRNAEQGKDTAFYQETLTAVFKECHRVLKKEGLLVFTFHHGAAEAWDALAQALKDAQFVIVRLWPVYAEMDVGVPVRGKRGLRFDTILVCRKNESASLHTLPPREAPDLLQQVREIAEELVEKLAPAFTLTQEDLLSLRRGIAAMLFTQGKTVLLPSAVPSTLRG